MGRARWLAWGSAAVLLACASGAAAVEVGVSVPGVGRAEATVPSVTVPSVTVPSVPPPAPLPSPITVSSAPAPSSPTPSVPGALDGTSLQPPAMAGSGTSAPAPVASGGGSSGGGAGDAPPTGGSAAGGTEAGAGSGVAGDTAREGRRPASGTRAPDDGRPGGAGGQRRIARTVMPLRQCLDDLGAEQRRVLALRAGIGPGAPLTRLQVARRLGIGVAQTGRIERRGLHRLDALAGAGACGGAARATSTALPAAGALALIDPTTDGAAGAGGDPSGALHPRFGVGGVVAHGDGRDDAGSRLGALPPPIGDGGEATLLIALGLLVVLALLVRRELLRR